MRFTILYHTGYGPDHYDLLLDREGEERLKTWRIDPADFSRPQIAIQHFDHRRVYLDYEGEISGGRGRVAIWDTGTCDAREWTEREIVISLNGTKVSGIVTLSCAGEAPGENSRWVLELKRPDDSPSTDGSAS